MSLAPGPLSAEQFLARAETLPRHAQLVDGEIVVCEPSPLHQHVVVEIVLQIRRWTDAGPGRGYVGIPVNVLLDERNVFAPDVWWRREPPTFEERYLAGPPDLVVEVRSPSTWRYDVHVKKTRYEQHGLGELWLVDTSAHSILVFRRSVPEETEFDVAFEVEAGDTLTSPRLPEFELDVAALFPAHRA